jgi:hypothetical protein
MKGTSEPFDWREFFGSREALENMYQAFKTRLTEEVMVDVPGTSHYGLLVDKAKE